MNERVAVASPAASPSPLCQSDERTPHTILTSCRAYTRPQSRHKQGITPKTARWMSTASAFVSAPLPVDVHRGMRPIEQRVLSR
jgi:hypothetical protein